MRLLLQTKIEKDIRYVLSDVHNKYRYSCCGGKEQIKQAMNQ